MLLRAFKYRTDTLDLLDRMDAIPSKAQRLNYNGLMRDLETYGLRSSLYQLCLIGETQQQSLINLLGDNYNGTNFGMTFVPGLHFVGDGTSTYLRTGFNPAAVPISQNNFSFGAYIRNNLTSANSFGCIDVGNSNGCLVLPRNASNQATIRICAGTSNNIAGQTSSTGLCVGHRSASNTVLYYRNGVSPSGGTQASSGALPNEVMAMGAGGRTPITTFNLYQYAGWFTALGLTAAQHLNLYRLFQRYLTNIGAAV